MKTDLQKEVAIQKKINSAMEVSLKRIIAKYGGVPALYADRDDMNNFIADVYIAGAADALETIKK